MFTRVSQRPGRGGDASDFSVDLAKMYAIKLAGTPRPLRDKVVFWLVDSELHAVACYRYGRFADDVRKRHRVLGAVAVASHRIWNRWTTHIDHVVLHQQAVIGPGLLIMHRHGVMVNAVIGENCVIHQNVTIGQHVAGGDQRVPRIGNNVWIGPGAIITGAITIGDGATISAGTVLSRDVPPGCLVAGNPGRVVAQNYDNTAMLNFVMPRNAPTR